LFVASGNGAEMALFALARLSRGFHPARDAGVDLGGALREVVDVLADVRRVHVVRAERVVRKHVLVEFGDALVVRDRLPVNGGTFPS
jgi:hypothetical protein